MKRIPKISWLFMAFSLLALSACGSGGAPVAPTVDTAPIFTQVALTAIALQTQIAQAVPSATDTPLASPTPQATNTPTATNTPLPTSTPTATALVLPASPNSAGPIPSMNVTLIANDTSTDSATVPINKVLIFRAEVKNTSDIPLQVVANLTVPDGWGVSENQFSDCPSTAELAYKDTCTITWKFNPTVSGQVILRVYVRGIYTDSAGNTQRITQSPAFVFNVEN